MRAPRWKVIASLCLLTGAISPVGSAQDEIKTESRSGPSCGLTSLWTLLHLEGHPIPMATLRARLPSEPAAGYSIAELREAAAACGLRTDVRQLSTNPEALDRPVLVFVRRNGHGHFLVIRPVGRGDKLQVLDGPRAPEVREGTQIVDAPTWTGIALVPVRPSWPARAVALAMFGGALACLIRPRGPGTRLESPATRQQNRPRSHAVERGRS